MLGAGGGDRQAGGGVGLTVADGDIVHADRHGAIIVPVTC